MTRSDRCRWHGPADEFIDACRPSAIERLVSHLGPPGTTFRAEWHARGESGAWAQSLPRLARLLERAELENCYVLLEYNPYQAGNARADAILAGVAPTGEDVYVVIELKQWSACELDPVDGRIRRTGTRWETPDGLLDPYDQALRYTRFIRNYTAGMDDSAVKFHPAAYLHNATSGSIQTLRSENWETGRAVFAGDAAGEASFVDALQSWLSREVDGRLAGVQLVEATYEQAPGLLDVAGEILTDPARYPLSDEQREIFAVIQRRVQDALAPSSERREAVIAITGGPGTGKTWIAMHLLGANAKAGRQVSYATNSTSLKSALAKRARDGLRSLDRPIDGLITSARTYWNEQGWTTPRDVLIVDEAHRIAKYTVRTGHRNRADIQASLEAGSITQLFELKKSTKVLVLFIDEDQSITPDDDCLLDDIRAVAERTGASFNTYALTEQHRSGGSEAYEQWVDALVSGKPTVWMDEDNFEVRVAESPEELEALTMEPGAKGSELGARLLAGFCWTWEKWPPNVSGIDDVPYDIRIGGWRKRWNLRNSIDKYPIHSSWASDPRGVAQVGSVFTSLGFEFGRCGVIIGPDFRWDPRSEQWIIDASEMRYDKLLRAVRGTPDIVERIRNHYRVLLTRAMAATVIYATDPATRRKLSELVNPGAARTAQRDVH